MLRAAREGQPLTLRSLPTHLRTAYPRRQDDCFDPSRGLASVEALYAAYSIMGHPTEGLLDHYYWREAFFEYNYGLSSLGKAT